MAAGSQAQFERLDVTSTEDAERVAASVIAANGPPDCVVANAVIAHRVPFDEMTEEKWDHTFDVDDDGNTTEILPWDLARRPRPRSRR